MNLLRLHIIAVLFAPLLHAQAPPADPIMSKLFPPEFIAANAELISLSESQQEKLRGALDQAKGRFEEFGPRLKEAAEALGKAIEEKGADHAAVMAQFEKVQDCEREMKRAQFGLMMELRGILNEEQRTWLTELKAKQAGQARERIERVKAAAAKLHEADSLLGEALKLIETSEK